jgi:isochorismate synthase
MHIEECQPASDWKRLIADTVWDIEHGKFEKVALARSLQVRVEHPIDIGRVLGRLRGAYPTASIFAFAHDDVCLLGATPERLVGVRSGIVRASGLAGTARRGTTAGEDALLGRQLLESSKDRHEHAVVVDMLRAAFAELCVDTHAPAEPRLVKLNNVQHLYTPVTGRLRAPFTLLDLIDRLHPTPAVGGLPRAAALDHIRLREGLDRGWYAAPIGWLDARGEGDFAVALRCGVVQGKQALIFAGAGIVQDSDPDEEYAETWLKFQPMLGALGGEAA